MIYFWQLFVNRKWKIIQLAVSPWPLNISIINSLRCLMVLVDDQIYMG